MTIIKAMKRCKKIKGELSDISARITKSLSCKVDEEFKESYSDLVKLYNDKSSELCNLKHRINIANVNSDIDLEIYRQNELKGMITILQNLEGRDGDIVDSESWRSTAVIKEKWKTQLTYKDKLAQLDKLQKELDVIVEKIDDFNAKTTV